MSVEYKDKGLEDLIKKLLSLEGLDVLVGYIGANGAETHPDSNISVATLAAIHEFGTEEIPARSYIRSTMIEQEAHIVEYWIEAIQDIILNDKDPISALSKIGQIISNLVLQKLDRANSWANPSSSEETSEEEADPTLLSGEYGLLRKNLGWAVTKDGAIIKQGKAI